MLAIQSIGVPPVYEICHDLDYLERVDPEYICVVEKSPNYAGELVWQTLHPQEFYTRYQDWLSRFLVLSQPFMAKEFVKQLDTDGWHVVFLESCRSILEAYARYEVPLDISGFSVPDEGSLYPFQSWSLQRALENTHSLYFVGWCPGAGKSLFAAAGAQELFNRNEIDVALAFTLTPLKTNLCQFFKTTTQLDVIVNDGTTDQRRKGYTQGHQGFILNFDKLWADFDSLKALVAQRRTLFILDEAQAVLTDGAKNRCRKALDQLVKFAQQPIVWPMSATVVNSSPFRYRDVFSLGNGVNPLGHKVDFEQRYVKSKKEYKIPTKTGKFFRQTKYTWNFARLQEIRHRVADQAHSVRKTDAGIRENFKGMQNIVVPIGMSDNDRELYEIVKGLAEEAMGRNENLGPYFRVLRYVCNNPEALFHTEDELGQAVLRDHRRLVTAAHCAKLAMLLGQVESIRDAGDKVVVFSHWTHLGVLLLAPHLSRHKINVALHYGVGQSAAESQRAQEEFKKDDNCTVFLSSDAGAFGLSLQCARSVINYDVPYSFDVLTQRNNRIDRADSYLDGLTSYVYLTEDTIEERIWKVLNERKALAAATLGTTEVLGYGDENDQSTLSYLIFGK